MTEEKRILVQNQKEVEKVQAWIASKLAQWVVMGNSRSPLYLCVEFHGKLNGKLNSRVTDRQDSSSDEPERMFLP